MKVPIWNWTTPKPQMWAHRGLISDWCQEFNFCKGQKIQHLIFKRIKAGATFCFWYFKFFLSFLEAQDCFFDLTNLLARYFIWAPSYYVMFLVEMLWFSLRSRADMSVFKNSPGEKSGFLWFCEVITAKRQEEHKPKLSKHPISRECFSIILKKRNDLKFRKHTEY